jgi:phage-related protein
MAFNAVFTNPNGLSINLTDNVNLYTLVGMDGELMPPFGFQEKTSPLISGSVVTAIYVTPRTLAWPVIIRDVDREALVERIRGILSILNPQLGDGQLLVTHGSKTGRLLNCRYRSGLPALNESQGVTTVRAVLNFYATDPFGYAPSSSQLTAQQNFAPPSFFPVLPITLATSAMETTAALENNGDVPAYPVITILGPSTSVIITNTTTGKKVEIATSIQAAETITIDTRPRTRSVRDQNGVNRFSLLTADSSMWALEIGTNNVEIEISGGDANTRVTVAYTPAYLTV